MLLQLEIAISNPQSQSILGRLQAARPGAVMPRLRARVSKLVGNRRFLRYSLVALNLALLGGIVAFAINGSQENPLTQQAVVSQTDRENAAEPLDQLSSADIAANAAMATGLAETTAVINQADSVASDLTMAPADTTVIAKPQTVATALKTKKDIKEYAAVAGDTVSSLAARFGVTSDSIMWSNGLGGNTIVAGTRLIIPPINGIVYTVKGGDTVDSLAQKYRTSREEIIKFNDIELTGLKVGDRILVPGGQNPAPVISYRASAPMMATFGYNGYDYGFCTWYVANRRAQVGNPVPSNLGNASTWDDRAASFGIQVNKTPAVGAAVVTSQRGAGHVAYVERVNDDGSIWVSEMNSYGQVSSTDSSPRGGWGVIDWKLIPASTAASYNYVY
jgi:surface antigen